MPIYAYQCSACGHAQDVLQKMSDSPLTVCPSCQQPTYVKQVTAAGFQLKGSGWYVTDFRNNQSGAAGGKDGAAKDGAGKDGAGKDGASKDSASKDGAAASAAKPAAANAPAPVTPSNAGR